MALIAVVGDIHGAINDMYKYLLSWQNRTEKKIDAVIHVGDFGGDIMLAPQDEPQYFHSDFKYYWTGEKVAPIQTYVNPGNHEETEVIKWWSQQPNRMLNLHLMPDGEITEICGKRVGAIWGNFSYKSWLNPERILTARLNHPRSPKARHIMRASVEKLQQAGEFDILITHDAPSRLMKRMGTMDESIARALGLDDDEYRHSQGCIGFNELYKTGKPKYHFFGHFHTYYVCQKADPLVICLHCFNYDQAQSVWFLETDDGKGLIPTESARQVEPPAQQVGMGHSG
jgi:predicted phosphodiesterase